MSTNTTYDKPKSSARPGESRSGGAPRGEASTASRIVKNPAHEHIAARAKAIWESKGCPSGQDEQIWCEAESQLRAELSNA